MDVPDSAETTNDKCPNKCGTLLVSWYEGYADFAYKVYYCSSCEERIQE